MNDGAPLVMQASAVAIEGHGLLLTGEPGVGKSSLTLALIDRGATLIGDDGVTLTRRGARIWVSPPPNIAGKIELRGIGIFELPTSKPVPLALILALDAESGRLPEAIPSRDLLGLAVPELAFTPGAIAPAVRAEWALKRYGLFD